MRTGLGKVLAVGLAGLCLAAGGVAVASADESPAVIAATDGTLVRVRDQAVSFTLQEGELPYVLCTADVAGMGPVTVEGPAGEQYRGTDCQGEHAWSGYGTQVWRPESVQSASGTYTLRFNPGAHTVRVFARPADAVVSTELDAAPVTVMMAIGQYAVVEVPGAPGDRIYAECSFADPTAVSGILVRADGAMVSSANDCAADSSADHRSMFTPFEVTSAGTFRVIVRPEETKTGPVTVSVRRLPADATGTVVIGGPTQDFTIAAAGQNAAFTFAADAGQTFTPAITYGPATAQLWWRVFDPAGKEVSRTFHGSAAPTVTAKTTGTYTVSMYFYGYAVTGTSIAIREVGQAG